jgi:hypothetical protein
MKKALSSATISCSSSLLDWNNSTPTLFSVLLWVKGFLSNEAMAMTKRIPSLDHFLFQIERIALHILPSNCNSQIIYNFILEPSCSFSQQFFPPIFASLAPSAAISRNLLTHTCLKIWRVHLFQELQSQSQQKQQLQLFHEETFWSRWLQINWEAILRERNRVSCSAASSSLLLTSTEKDFIEFLMTLLMKSLSPEDSQRGLTSLISPRI